MADSLDSSSRGLVDVSDDALIALALDGRVRSWSRGAERPFGDRADEATGRALDELTVVDEVASHLAAVDPPETR